MKSKKYLKIIFLFMLFPVFCSKVFGKNISEKFLINGDQKAHVLLRHGAESRLLVCFPAGNVAAAIWFNSLDKPHAVFTLKDARLVGPNYRGEWGCEVSLQTEVVPFYLNRTLFHNIRTVRGYAEGYPAYDRKRLLKILALLSELPEELIQRLEKININQEKLKTWLKILPVQKEENHLIYKRPLLGSRDSLQLHLKFKNARLTVCDSEILVQPLGKKKISIDILSLCPYKPAKIIAASAILSRHGNRLMQKLKTRNPGLFDDAKKALEGLSFLSSENAYLAGSWRFLTYFGRDTLISLLLMGPYLSEKAWYAGISSVLKRLANDGTVAHEEALEEHGILEKLYKFTKQYKKDRKHALTHLDELEKKNYSELVYPMIDTDLLLPLALAGMAKLYPEGVKKLFRSFPEQTRKNLQKVVQLAGGKAKRESDAKNNISGLLRIGKDEIVGDWRDSGTGLGRGTYPASVNACLMPAVIESLRLLWQHGFISEEMGIKNIEKIDLLSSRWKTFFKRFIFEIKPDESVDSTKAMLKMNSFPPSFGAKKMTPWKALALSLDDAGKPVRVVHTDGLFLLLSPRSPGVDLETALNPLLREFPVGLNTKAGPLVANAANAGEVQSIFRTNHYHGLVVWGWPMTLARLGVRTLKKWGHFKLAKKLSAIVKGWGPAHIEAAELWTIKYKDGEIASVPFGFNKKDVTESNSLQLWSLASLAAVLSELEDTP
ncbi:hypothetical protein ACFL35_09845 [Candidatus Riflebacteria bacterium]